MAEEEKVAAAVESTTASAPVTGAAAPNPDMVSMTKAEFEAFVKAKVDPWQKRHSDSEAAFGQYKKTHQLPEGALDAVRNFEDMKAIVADLGVDPEDIKEAETVRDLKLLLKGRKGAPAKSPSRNPGEYAEFQEWQKGQRSQNGDVKPFVQIPSRGGSAPPPEDLTALVRKPTNRMNQKELAEHNTKLDAAMRASMR